MIDEEEHQDHPTVVWFPLEVWDVAKKKGITLNELILLDKIFCLCDYKNKTACWAGDEWFAKELGTTKVVIQRWIKNLKKLGFIWTVFFDGRHRYLTTKWFDLEVKGRYRTKDGQRIRKPKKRSQPKSSAHNKKVVSGSKQKSSELYYPPDSKIHTYRSKRLAKSRASKNTDGKFFPDENGKEDKTSQFDKDAAKHLFDILKRHGRVPPNHGYKKVKYKSWAEDFRKLREVDGATEVEIDQILDWYDDHIKDRFCPQPRLGKSFREMFFTKLKPALERDQEKTGGNVKISKNAEKIYAEISDEMPDEFDSKEMKIVIQKSLDTYVRFYKACRDFKPRTRSFTQSNHEFLLQDLPSGSSYISQWMSEGFEMVHRMGPNWKGTESSLTFHLDHRKFKKFHSEMMSSYNCPSIEGIMSYADRT